jgi:hypothetical protein
MLILAGTAACAHRGVAPAATPPQGATTSAPAASPAAPASPEQAAVAPAGGRRDQPGVGPCATCGTPRPTDEVARALEERIAELKARGGPCSSYAAVLESSYRTGRITIRPYMWRVGTQLASGEAKPNGEMVLAREIDPLNVGLRTLDELLWTMEHEAAHIAFDIDNGTGAGEDQANSYVRACRS